MAATGTETTRQLDALVVGAGFGGIYMLHKLRNELGLDAVAIDKAAGVGGTWYWNKYPGALSDSEGFVYQYSFDRDLYTQTPWKTKFVRQPEILEYLNGVVDRYDLREHIALETAMTDASFDEVAGIWTVHTDRGVTFECRFLVNGLGLLSATNVPDFPGMETFAGRLVHTGAWPEDLDLTGKRIGVIGNGSTGNQVITAAAPIAGHLTSFQRTPQYSVPAGNRELTPTDLYARRPLCDSGYYEAFNRPNVSLVSLKETPITQVTEKGIVTADGTLHELDVLILATGFDAVDGNYVRVDIRGRDGVSLKDHWSDGPTSYLGVATSGFPNMFMILGPNGPFTNLPPSIETQVEWIADTISHASRTDAGWLDVKPEVETAWTETCADIADQTLFPRAASWIFGANIPGKKRTVMFYLGGIKEYRSITSAESASGYPGFLSSADVLAEA